jgi:Elongation factor G C-terminus
VDGDAADVVPAQLDLTRMQPGAEPDVEVAELATKGDHAFDRPPPGRVFKIERSPAGEKMDALQQAGTRVFAPIHRFRLEVPSDTLGAVLYVLAQLGAVSHTPAPHGTSYLLEGGIPAARVHELQLQLATLTRGEGVLESAFERYALVRGVVRTRARTDHTPRP